MPTGNPVEVGDRIELGDIQPLDFYPKNFTNLANKLGTVISADDSMIEVEIDEKFPELDEWDNVLQFSEGVCEILISHMYENGTGVFFQ